LVSISPIPIIEKGELLFWHQAPEEINSTVI
jgi:hypothetical protein